MKLNIRTISFSIIIIICVMAIVIAISMLFPSLQGEEENTILEEEAMSQENQLLAEQFQTLFANTLDYQGDNVDILGISKVSSSQDIVYTQQSKKEVVANRYDIDLNIPYINISNNTSVEQFNERIQSLYIDKAQDIIQNATNHTIYSIDYMAYVNTNILSLVIRSTLKEGNHPQRVIIQTYNYNLSTNEPMTLDQILEIKGLNPEKVEKTIRSNIKEANNEAESLKHLGYNVYIRDIESDIYQLENTDYYILGPNNKLYIIYPYGNANFTDEMDVIVF